MFDLLIAPSIAVLLLINVLDSLDLLGLRRCAGQSARRRRDADGPAGDGPDAARRRAAWRATRLTLPLAVAFRRLRGRQLRPRQIEADRADFVDRARIDTAQVARGLKRGVFVGAIDDIKA